MIELEWLNSINLEETTNLFDTGVKFVAPLLKINVSFTKYFFLSKLNRVDYIPLQAYLYFVQIWACTFVFTYWAFNNSSYQESNKNLIWFSPCVQFNFSRGSECQISVKRGPDSRPISKSCYPSWVEAR